jgi:hypothetical protein
MSIESFNQFNNPPKIEKNKTDESDQALFRDAENKIEILDSFLATGDIVSDYNYFLEITNRRINYKRATNEPQEELLKNLENILDSLSEEQDERSDTIYQNEASRMYYQEVPKMEIKVLKELLDFYQIKSKK